MTTPKGFDHDACNGEVVLVFVEYRAPRQATIDHAKGTSCREYVVVAVAFQQINKQCDMSQCDRLIPASFVFLEMEYAGASGGRT